MDYVNIGWLLLRNVFRMGPVIELEKLSVHG